jgi:hypothetical protein
MMDECSRHPPGSNDKNYDYSLPNDFCKIVVVVPKQGSAAPITIISYPNENEKGDGSLWAR